MATNEILIIQCDPERAAKVSNDYFLLGIDPESGETFGNGTFEALNFTLCASFDGVIMIQAGKKGVLFPLGWLGREFPHRHKVWQSQRNALYQYAQQNNLPFHEPFDNPRLDRLLELLKQRYNGEACMRDLNRRNQYKTDEVQQLAKAFPDRIAIESSGSRGGRPAKVVKLLKSASENQI
jgi:hypothetical protein